MYLVINEFGRRENLLASLRYVFLVAACQDTCRGRECQAVGETTLSHTVQTGTNKNPLKKTMRAKRALFFLMDFWSEGSGQYGMSVSKNTVQVLKVLYRWHKEVPSVQRTNENRMI